MRLVLCLILISVSLPLNAADSVPRCWVQDRPLDDIQDGLFRLQIATSGTSARDVALIVGLLSQSLANQKGVAPSGDLEHLEIDVFWRNQILATHASVPNA